jgi:hypothetical protein
LGKEDEMNDYYGQDGDPDFDTPDQCFECGKYQEKGETFHAGLVEENTSYPDGELTPVSICDSCRRAICDPLGEVRSRLRYPGTVLRGF